MIKWFGHKIYFHENLIWNYIYSLRIREYPIERGSLPIYFRLEHRLIVDDNDLVLEVRSPEGFIFDIKKIGYSDNVDSGRLLTDLLYIYLRSYEERARSYESEIYEYIDHTLIYDKLCSITKNLRPPVVAGLLETIYITETGRNIYAQLTLHVNWNYIIDYKSFYK
jgi:hypothetical protein